MRMRGTSSDRILAKKLKREQKSLSSLGDKATNSSGSTSSSLFEKHLGKFYRLGKLEKSKRSSASALYDRSPTEAFYNKTGSARLSSQELFEKFCSEDFVSLYGHENDNGNYYAYHSKSVGSSGSETGRAQYHTDTELSASHANLGAIRKTPQFGKKIHPFKNKFSFDVPFTLSPGMHNITDYEINDSNESLTIKDHSLSAPLLSPDKAEARFTFDISEKSEGVSNSNQDETPSDATETRNLTLYEEPYSDRTSLSEMFELSFARSSFKRDGSRRKARTIDLSTLDFRAIDDESPNTSNYVSLTSPDDTIPFNSDSKSYYSDSVFTTPEKKSTPSTIKLANLRISERSDSTTLEEEPKSAINKLPEILIEKVDQLSLDRTITPVEESATVTVLDVAPICSRPSMHKLEPFVPKTKPSPVETDLDAIVYEENIDEEYQKVKSPPELTDQRVKSMFFKIKKVRDASAVTVHRRTRCFPL